MLPVAILDAAYAKSIAEIDQAIKSTGYSLLFSSFSFPSFSPANFDRSHATWALGVLGAAHMHGNPIALRPHTAARYGALRAPQKILTGTHRHMESLMGLPFGPLLIVVAFGWLSKWLLVIETQGARPRAPKSC